VDKPGAPQTYVTCAQPALSRLDPRYPAFVVLNAALGGQFTSRINMNLREDKGVTYGAQSYLESRPGILPWVLATSVQTDRTAESLSEIRREVARIAADEPLTEREFQNARDSLVLKYPQSFETQAQLATGLASLWTLGLPDDYHARMLAALEGVTLEECRRAGAEILDPETLVWVVVGDGAALSAALPGAGLGPVLAAALP
jgi:zinc protease